MVLKGSRTHAKPDNDGGGTHGFSTKLLAGSRRTAIGAIIIPGVAR